MKRLLIAAAALLLSRTPAFAADTLLITGAGATFPFPLYSKWFSDYHKQHPAFQFNYQSIGSGGGIKQVTEKTVDFGASDAPLTDAQLAKIPTIQHIPTVLGAVVLTWNAPFQGLKLTPETLADLYLGKITKWNDARLAKENPGVKLPDAAVAIVHRSDGSGTTNIFTNYLSKVSPEWKERVGFGTSVKWPAGLGAKGNEGVTGTVKGTPGAIGYVELAYAKENKLPMALLRNREGNFVPATLESTSLAAAGVEMPADYRVSITDAKGAGAYPIAAFTYLLVYRDQGDRAKGEALLHFLWWAVHDGQKAAPALDYAPLPPAVVKMVEKSLQGMTVQGRSVQLAASR